MLGHSHPRPAALLRSFPHIATIPVPSSSPSLVETHHEKGDNTTAKAQSTQDQNEAAQVGNHLDDEKVIDDEVVTVDWDGLEDPRKPLNLPLWRKWVIVGFTSLNTLCVCFTSSIYADIMMTMPKMFAVACIFFQTVGLLAPALGPVAGAYITASSLGWRWTAWVMLIVTGPIALLAWFAIPGTSAFILLKREAKALNRKRTSNTRVTYVSALGSQALTWNGFVRRYLKIPLHMLIVEPLLIILTIYVALVYGFLYLTFEAFPISFGEDRGWSFGNSTLPFFGLAGGMVAASVLIIAFPSLLRSCSKKQPKPRDLQFGLMMLGAIILPIGLFWFSGTCSPHINPAPQIISTVAIGLGIQLIFVPSMLC
ncbi:hypothetical protein PRZ48_011535 [Zasmidium cellare]|uniref:Major facilitator superfamily (MFS) profile domain-containing protein n=1 Tax=Zasmidium cellare TaxID=395010 RepID=A0ABR0E6T9_ZASCE|nr:hypothetical protein PRZ48_011535 [Zasmidium cellare]